jgi:RNA polymerase-associated protein
MIVQIVDFVRNKPYFASDELSLVDVTIAPLLWRLPRYRIDLPKEATPLLKYANLLFSRPAFRLSLSAQEREMRLA